MTRLQTPLVGVSLLALALAAAPLRAGSRELKTVESAAEAVHALAAIPLNCIPQSLVQESAGVAVIPHVIKAGFVIDGRFGRGVVLAREPGGRWSNPVFITLGGGGVGGQIGVESTDLVLIFKTKASLDRILRGKGKLTLGGDLSVAAGPVGREAAAATDGRLKAEIYTYSRSRGLFAGVSLEGAALLVDHRANEAFYGLRGCRPEDVLARRIAAVPALESLKAQLSWLAGPPPAVLVPVPPPPGPPPAVIVPGPLPLIRR
jgi:lipid-binding SYLF domain-containing protein